MEEKELKTSPKQRIFIAAIAIIMLGSMVAGYAAMILGNSKNNANTSEQGISEEKKMQYEEAYNATLKEFRTASQHDFNKFIKYKNRITAYNETSANDKGVVVKDIVVGDGRELKEGDSDYLAYYVGWCADESIFDSSFNDNENPTSFDKILSASLGMIEGWTTGIVGMRLNGIREITVPGSLAYKDQMEICGGYNKPLKFLIMTKRTNGELKKIADRLDTDYMRYTYAQYGIDYDTINQ